MSKEFVWDDKLVGKYANYVHDNVAAGQAVWHSTMIEQFKKENQPIEVSYTIEDMEEAFNAARLLTSGIKVTGYMGAGVMYKNVHSYLLSKELAKSKLK